VHATHTSQEEDRRKKQHSAGARVPTSRTKNQAPIKADPWTRVRRVRFQQTLLHRGTADESVASSPPFSIRDLLTLAPLTAGSLTPLQLVILSPLSTELSQTSRLRETGSSIVAAQKAPRLVSRKVERKTWVLHITHSCLRSPLPTYLFFCSAKCLL
jgi:hypothetical protein